MTPKSAITRRWSRRHREAVNAHAAVYYSKRTGALTPPEACEKCGAVGVRLDAHHPNHANRRDVYWYCRACHCEERIKGLVFPADYAGPTKACSTCGKTWPDLPEFFHGKRQCMDCRRAYIREYQRRRRGYRGQPPEVTP